MSIFAIQKKEIARKMNICKIHRLLQSPVTEVSTDYTIFIFSGTFKKNSNSLYD